MTFLIKCNFSNGVKQMNPELIAAKQAAEIAQDNYQKMLNDAKTEQIATIKQIMQDYSITVNELTATKPVVKPEAAKSGVYRDTTGKEHTYIIKKGRKPEWFKGSVFVRDLPVA
jgi:DNA-binding protein H-NS